MTRLVRPAAIQPPHPYKDLSNAQMLQRSLELLDDAGKQGADIALLPELINIFMVPPEQYPQKIGAELDDLKRKTAEVAARHRMYVILPVLNPHKDHLHNSSLIFDRSGQIIGRYDKIHLTDQEYDEFPTIKAGDSFPVFDLDFGRIGIMTCADCAFPEVAEIYDLQDVDILFYPRWQSGPSEIFFEIQMRSRAIDHLIFLVSSSFGVSPNRAWKPGMLFGRSCIIGRDGTFIADAGHIEGIAIATIDLDRPQLMDVLDDVYGSDIRDVRTMRHAARRPDLYGLLTKQGMGERGPR
ncbi:MAG: carbon-nitrogen hydrolase family protein [Anaerolineae bacterium]|nr:carbon-nitrogen hydrolase family protein [Anaerolineae bacterium]